MLMEHIVTDQRYYPDYYRVTFYGNFPAAIRDKRFIVCDFKIIASLPAEAGLSIVVMNGKSLVLSVKEC